VSSGRQDIGDLGFNEGSILTSIVESIHPIHHRQSIIGGGQNRAMVLGFRAGFCACRIEKSQAKVGEETSRKRTIESTKEDYVMSGSGG
jgi:hypothetical protein